MKYRPLFWIFLGLMIVILICRSTGRPIFGEPAESDREAIDSCCASEEDVCLVGTVSDREIKTNSIQYILKNSYLINSEDSFTIPCKTILLRTEKNGSLSVGSTLRAYGSLSRFEKAGNPGQFDAASYYANQGIYYSMWAENVRSLSEGNFFLEGMTRLRELLSQALVDVMSEESAGILCAMLYGNKSLLLPETKWNFQAGGLMHILAISGMHLMLLGTAVITMLRFLRLPDAAARSIAAILMLFYAMFCGSSVSAVRACIMFCVMQVGSIFHRSYDIFCAFSFADILVLLNSPGELFSSGFQFSFAAVFAAALVVPKLRKQVESHDRKQKKVSLPKPLEKLLRGGRERLLSCVGISLFVLPITLWYYFEIPIFSLLPNLLLLPVLGYILLWGITGSLIMLFHIPLAGLILWPLDQFLCFFSSFLDRLSNLPFSTIICGRPSFWMIPIYYIFFFFLLAFLCRKSKKEKRHAGLCQYAKKIKRGGILRILALTAAQLLITGWLLFFRIQSDAVMMLDVGQGDCLLITTEKGKAFLVDGGSTSVDSVGLYRILPCLKEIGIRHLNGIFLSHGDLDHIGGVQEILEMIRDGNTALTCDALYMPINMKDTQKGWELETLAEDAGSSVAYLRAGDRFLADTMQLDILYPFSDVPMEDSNAGSMVLSVTEDDFSMLLTGDLQGEGESELLPYLGQYDCLKVAHHGSKNASSEEFLEIVSPQIALISAPENSIYGHPHREVLERLATVGADIYVTKECGAITISLQKISGADGDRKVVLSTFFVDG